MLALIHLLAANNGPCLDRLAAGYQMSAAEQYIFNLRRLRNRWVAIDTDFLFPNSFNASAILDGQFWDFRLDGKDVQTWGPGEYMIDFLGDEHLERVCKAICSGQIRCHSYSHKTRSFVDLQTPEEKVPQILENISLSQITAFRNIRNP